MKRTKTNAAIQHFADVYYSAVVGVDFEDAADYAMAVAERCMRERENQSDSMVSARIYSEACRYEDM